MAINHMLVSFSVTFDDKGNSGMIHWQKNVKLLSVTLTILFLFSTIIFTEKRQ